MAEYTATSGSYTTTLTVTEGTYNVANNTSPVTFTLTLKKNSGTGLWNNDSCPWSININGTSYSGTFTYDFRDYSSLTLKSSTTQTITHDGDGTKSISVSASVNMDNTPYVYTMSPSGTLTLTTIPRASDVTVSNYSIANTTGSLSATITSKANFYHKWRWKLGSGSWSAWATKGQINTTSSTVTVANTTLLAQLPTSTSGSFNIEVATYSDSGYSNHVGTKSATCTVSVNTSNIKPSVSLGNIGLNSTPISGYAVAGYSKVQSAWTTTNSSGATSVTTYFTVSTGSLATTSSSSTSGTVVSNVIPSNTSNYTLTIYAYAKDSRGAVGATVSKSITVYGYQPPTANLTAYRTSSSSSTSEDGAGTYAYVTFSGAVRSSVNSQNSIQSTVCTYSGSISGTATNGGHYALADTQTVTFKLTVTDKVTSSTASVTIATASYPLDLYDDGNGNVGMGIGAVAEGNYVKLGADLHTKGNWLTTNGIRLSNLNQTTEGVAMWGPEATNKPCDYGVLYTLGLDGDSSSAQWYSQIAFGTNGIIYFRNSINSAGETWSSWSSFYGAFNPQTSVANATNATNATLADHANYLNLVATNEIRMGNRLTTLGDIWFNYSWSDGKYETLRSYRFGNGNAGYAYVTASNFYNQYGCKAPMEYTLWTGTLKGNNPISLDMSQYSRIRVWVNLYAVNGCYEIDLTHSAAYQQISGYPYCGGITIAEYTGGGTLELLTSEGLVTTNKKTFSHFHCGYYTPGNSSSTNKDNDANYYVYKIEGIL